VAAKPGFFDTWAGVSLVAFKTATWIGGVALGPVVLLPAAAVGFVAAISTLGDNNNASASGKTALSITITPATVPPASDEAEATSAAPLTAGLERLSERYFILVENIFAIQHNLPTIDVPPECMAPVSPDDVHPELRELVDLLNAALACDTSELFQLGAEMAGLYPPTPVDEGFRAFEQNIAADRHKHQAVFIECSWDMYRLLARTDLPQQSPNTRPSV
jgi:hypothetical protein